MSLLPLFAGNNIVALPVEMSRPFSVARDTTGGGGYVTVVHVFVSGR